MAKRTCTIDGCTKESRYKSGRGWCSMHDERHRKYGSTDDPRPSFEERLWSRVDKSGDCWLWTGSVNSAGYGQIERQDAEGNRQGLRVHRAVWELLFGPIPDGMVLCHHCDNPPCCNPSHLFVGTPADNTRDMISKGRAAKPSALPPAERAARLAGTSPKLCLRCGDVKAPEEFGPNAARNDGLQVYCSPCTKTYSRQRRKAS